MPASERDERIWDYVLKASVPIVLGIGAAVITHEVRISNLEETRVRKTEMIKYVQENAPPEWLKDQLLRLESKVDKLSEKVK